MSGTGTENAGVKEQIKAQEQADTESYSNAFTEAAAKKSGAEENIEFVDKDDSGSPDEPVEKNLAPEPAPAPEPADTDPYANLSDWQREHFRKIENQFKSNNGRISAYQRQIQDLTDKLNNMVPAQAAQPTAEEVGEALQDESSWASFTEEYPEIAAAFETRLSQAEKKIEEKLSTTITPVLEQTRKVEKREGYDYLDSHYEGWRDRVSTPEFADWLGQQRPEIRKWADSDNVADAESLITLFDNHLIASGNMSQANQAGFTPPNSSDRADALASKRRQQMEDGEQPVRSSGAGVSVDRSSTENEYSSAFQVYARKKERERQAAGIS